MRYAVIGVVLSGMLKDGTPLGLEAIREAGGIALVQSPAEAAYPDMPRNPMALDGDTISSPRSMPSPRA